MLWTAKLPLPSYFYYGFDTIIRNVAGTHKLQWELFFPFFKASSYPIPQLQGGVCSSTLMATIFHSSI